MVNVDLPTCQHDGENKNCAQSKKKCDLYSWRIPRFQKLWSLAVKKRRGVRMTGGPGWKESMEKYKERRQPKSSLSVAMIPLGEILPLCLVGLRSDGSETAHSSQQYYCMSTGLLK